MSQRISKSVFLMTMKSMLSKEIQMEGDPTSFEKAIRSVYSFEW